VKTAGLEEREKEKRGGGSTVSGYPGVGAGSRATRLGQQLGYVKLRA